MTGRLASGPISSRPFSTTFETCVRQVQRGRPLTVIAHGRTRRPGRRNGRRAWDRRDAGSTSRRRARSGCRAAARRKLDSRPLRRRARRETSIAVRCRAHARTVTLTLWIMLLPNPLRPSAPRAAASRRSRRWRDRKSRARRGPRSIRCQPRQAKRPCGASRILPHAVDTELHLRDRHAVAGPRAAEERHRSRRHQPMARVPVGNAGRHHQRLHPHMRDGAPGSSGSGDNVGPDLLLALIGLIQHLDAVEPFDARHAVPAGHDQAQRKAVLRQQRRPVHGPDQQHVVAQRQLRARLRPKACS